MKLIQELMSLTVEGAFKDLHVDLLDAIHHEFDVDDDMAWQIAEYVLTGDDNDKVEAFLYDHFVKSGEMPYGVQKARDGDPASWIADKLSDMFTKQVKAITAAEKTVKEDWGSSDWSALFNSVQKMIAKGESADDAVEMAAEMYSTMMGYDSIDDCIAEILRMGKARKHAWVNDIKRHAELMQST